MHKERIFAIVVGAIMLISVAGFASSGLKFTGNQAADSQQGSNLSTINYRYLEGREISSIVGQGGVVIEAVYNGNCTVCREKAKALEMFATSQSQFIVMESVETADGEGWEKFQMIGNRGQITLLEEQEISQEALLDLFCSIAVVAPKECLLKSFAEQSTQQSSE